MYLKFRKHFSCAYIIMYITDIVANQKNSMESSRQVCTVFATELAGT